MSTLRLQRPGESPREVAQDRAVVGRDASCDLVVVDKSVSRRHALLERRGAAWAVTDQGSANGTFLDGKPVSASALRNGQELRFGMVSFRVEIEADMPQTMLMPAGGQEVGSTMLMPNPSLPAPPAGRPPAPVAPARPLPPPAPPRAAPPPGPARRPMEPPAASPRSLTPREEAAAFLGLPVGASPEAVGRRFEEMSGDLEAKVQTAPTPALRERYQRNLDELRKACEALAPGFGGSPRLEDLPSAQPTVVPDQMDVSMPAPLRAAPGAVDEASAVSAGAPPPATTAVGFLVATIMALCAFFCMSNTKMQKAYVATEKSSGLSQARASAELYSSMENLEKAGALVLGQLKLCSKARTPLEVKWLGGVYRDVGASGESRIKSYNSDNCPKEFNLTLAPGSEETIGLKGASEKCTWDGRGLFYAFAIKDPGAPDKMLRFSGTLNNRQDCVTIGEGL